MIEEKYFVDRIYDLSEDKSLELVWRTFFQVGLNYVWMDNVLSLLIRDDRQMHLSVIYAVLCGTSKYSDSLKNHSAYWDKAVKAFSEKYGQEKSKTLLYGVREAGHYWQSMEEYGAPEWFSGKKPEHLKK